MSCSHPTTYMLCVLGYSHLQLFHESRVTMFLEIFQRTTSHEDKEFTPLWPVASVFPKSIFIWKTCWPTYIYFSMAYAKEHMCQIMIVSLWGNSSESWVTAGGLQFRGNCRQSRKWNTLLSLLVGPRLLFPGWYDLSKDSMLFPMLTYQTIFYFPIKI